MGKSDLVELCQWKKRQMLKLMEVSDLTEQLVQAVERRDQVSVGMLMSMRREPIQQAQELEKMVQEHLRILPPEEAARFSELLNGDPARTGEEEPLADQVAQNRRILEQVRRMDARASVKLGGKQSFYAKETTREFVNTGV